MTIARDLSVILGHLVDALERPQASSERDLEVVYPVQVSLWQDDLMSVREAVQRSIWLAFGANRSSQT